MGRSTHRGGVDSSSTFCAIIMPAHPSAVRYARRAVDLRALRPVARCAAALCAMAMVMVMVMFTVPLAAQTSAPAAKTRVFGQVFDSIAMRPLPGALVQLVQADDPAVVRTATADTRGAFAFDAVDRGAYLLGFFHPRLDSLSLTSPLMRVDVRVAGALQASLGIPSSTTLLTTFCGASALRDTIGLFQGRVRQVSGAPITAPAKVRVQWAELVLGSRGLERRTPSVLATTSADGAFAVCGVPAGSMMMTRAFSGSDSSGFVELALPITGYLNRDLLVSSVTKTTPNDGFPMLTVSRGDGVLRGTVRNFRGEPVPGARVGVWSSGIEVSTNATGQYTMRALPSGTYTLEARAVGFQLGRLPVDIDATGSATADVTLERLATLDTVRVKASRMYTSRALEEFDTRRKAGGGFFLDDVAIEKRQAVTMADLFRVAPGVTVLPGQAFGDQVLMKGAGGYCIPAIFLNGNRIVNEEGSLDQLADPREVRGVEVYSRGAMVPVQFQSSSGCGAIVLWVGTPR